MAFFNFLEFFLQFDSTHQKTLFYKPHLNLKNQPNQGDNLFSFLSKMTELMKTFWLNSDKFYIF